MRPRHAPAAKFLLLNESCYVPVKQFGIFFKLLGIGAIILKHSLSVSYYCRDLKIETATRQQCFMIALFVANLASAEHAG